MSSATTAMKPPTAASSPKKIAKFNVLSHVRYEHLVAGISGGVTSTLILHPLDLIKIRFAGKSSNLN
jgi:solute carrier family 25 folate transporter 32